MAPLAAAAVAAVAAASPAKAEDEMSFSNYMHSGVKKRNVLNL